MKMTRDQYVTQREFFIKQANRSIRDGKEDRADYYTGIVRGLDLAFGEGSASTLSQFNSNVVGA